MKNGAKTGRAGRYAARYLIGAVSVVGVLVGCVQKPDIAADAALHRQAAAAFEAGNYAQARRLIARADRLQVPQAELWRRTLELRMVLAGETPSGELRRFLDAWAAHRSDWSPADAAEAELALVEALKPALAADWLYDLDANTWPAAQQTRYNLLLSELQKGQPALRDEQVARWRLAIRGLYEAGNLTAAAREAARCAREDASVESALLAAELYHELGNQPERDAQLAAAESLSPTAAVRVRVEQIRALPKGARVAFPRVPAQEEREVQTR